MNALKLVAALLFVFFTIACGSSADESTQTLPTKTTDTALNRNQIIPPKITAPATNGSVALNPAHGQPGHRCDISVGAPLNSAPANSNSNTGQTQPVIMPTTPAPSPAPATGGTGAKNPAHGQPGHRCDIAVGAPLN
jgi:uncharacterized lipoprotein